MFVFGILMEEAAQAKVKETCVTARSLVRVAFQINMKISFYIVSSAVLNITGPVIYLRKLDDTD